MNNRVVIQTALPIEYAAVRAQLSEIRSVSHPRGTLYEVGTAGSYEVAICQTGVGNPIAAIEAERAIAHFDPAILLFVGVAGGLKDVNLGDVVAATKVYSYASGKAAAEFLPRPSMGESSYRLVQRAQVVAREEQWTKSPRAFVAPIAAGESVLSDSRAELFRFLQQNYSDALAIEMEGYGALRAVYASHPVEGMVIRGISDRIDDKTNADKAGWQKNAAENASRFAFGMLKLPGGFVRENSPVSLPRQGAPEVVLLAADADEKYLNRMEAHLNILEHQGLLKVWHRGKVVLGRRMQDELERHVSEAAILLTFLSPDFFQHHQAELSLAFEQQNRGGIVIPINVRPMAGIRETFRGMVALPRDGRALSTWKNLDEACCDVAEEVLKLIRS